MSPPGVDAALYQPRYSCHCEERSDEATSSRSALRPSRLLRFARNDIRLIGAPNGPMSVSDEPDHATPCRLGAVFRRAGFDNLSRLGARPVRFGRDDRLRL